MERKRPRFFRDGFCFQANELSGALLFRRRCAFMGTSRMTIRRNLAQQIGPIPPEIQIQADEYIYTLAPVLMPLRILPEALTYYRVHADNAFHMLNADPVKLRHKQKSLAALVKTLSLRLSQLGIGSEVRRALLDYTDASADQLRLSLDGGWSWETVATEWKIYRVTHPNATVAYRVFKSLTLLTALFAPPKTFYRTQKALAQNQLYHRLRYKCFRSPKWNTSRGMARLAKDLHVENSDCHWVLRAREAGAAGVVFNHAEQLEKLGHQVDSWFFDDVLPSPRWPTRFRDLEFAVAVSSRLRRQPQQYDVVNLHAPWGCVYGLSRKWFPSVELPPYVFTMQGSEERFARAMKLEHRKGRAANFAWKNRVWHRLYHQTMYDFSISTADFGAVANREGWILSELKYGHPPGRISYVPNGVSEEFFQPRIFADVPANRLLYVGTWLDRKGIHYLADAFTALAARSPEIQLTVAGCILAEEQVKAYFPIAIRNRISVLPFLSSRRDARALRCA